MASHVRKQIRDAAVTALTNLTTTTTHVFDSRTYELQEADLPGLRIFTNIEDISPLELGGNRVVDRQLELVVEGCSKKSSALDDELDAIVKEVEVAVAGNQGMGGAKWVQLRRIEIDMEGEAEKDVGIARMTFEVHYNTALATPDIAQ